MELIMKIDDLSLREKKHVKTKIELAKAFAKMLETTRINDISIKEVCRQVEVSEATFYNYFPAKKDIMSYIVRLFMFKIIWLNEKNFDHKNILKNINDVFQHMARENKDSHIIYEVEAFFLGERISRDVKKLSTAELQVAFPECGQIEQVDIRGIEEYLRKLVKMAIEHKELPSKINIDDTIIALATILVGTPIALDFNKIARMGEYFEKQLNLLWKGLRA
jgi:AcrR family transcriptional regulator